MRVFRVIHKYAAFSKGSSWKTFSRVIVGPHNVRVVLCRNQPDVRNGLP